MFLHSSSPHHSTDYDVFSKNPPLIFLHFLTSQTPSPPSSHRSIPMKVIEHIVLLKVKPGTDPSKVNSMLSGLNALVSLHPVLHLAAAPVHRNGSSNFTFTHMLHSRYASKQDLAAYSAHPNHISVVKDSVLPICDDVMALDWVADDLAGDVAPRPGSGIRVTFLKLKEGCGEEVKGEIMRGLKLKDGLGAIEQMSCGENFSPARAKGFSIASLAVFPGVKEMEAADSREELVKAHKENLEGVIVVDCVVPSSISARL